MELIYIPVVDYMYKYIYKVLLGRKFAYFLNFRPFQNNANVMKYGQRVNQKLLTEFSSRILNLLLTERSHKNPSIKVLSRIYLENSGNNFWFNRFF